MAKSKKLQLKKKDTYNLRLLGLVIVLALSGFAFIRQIRGETAPGTTSISLSGSFPKPENSHTTSAQPTPTPTAAIGTNAADEQTSEQTNQQQTSGATPTPTIQTNTSSPTPSPTPTVTPTPTATQTTSHIKVQAYFYTPNQYPVTNATVRIYDAQSGDILASGTTNNSGYWGSAHIAANTNINVQIFYSCNPTKAYNTDVYGTAISVSFNFPANCS